MLMGLEKRARVNAARNLVDKAKSLVSVDSFISYLNRSPKAEAALRKALSYNLVDPRNRALNTAVGSTAGALTGSGTGAVTADKEDRGRDSLWGGGIGAATGALAGRFGPKVMQRSLGRVLTNMMDPYDYNTGMHEGNLKQIGGLKNAIKRVWRDQPLNDLQATDTGRLALFRDYFDLKRFKGTEDHFNTVGKAKDGGKIVELNRNSTKGLKDLREVDDVRIKSVLGDNALESVDGGLRYNASRHMRANKPTLVRAGAMSHFHIDPDGKWKDRWDFDLHPGEKIDSKANLLRALVTPFGTPTTVVGRTFDQADALRNSKPGKKYEQIHESFTAPVVNRAVRGAGIDKGELDNYLKAKGDAGDMSAFTSTIANKAEGKPYNLLQSIAKSEGVTLGDARVMLGGKERVKDKVSKVRAATIDLNDAAKMFANRIPDASLPAVQEALNSMSAADKKILSSKLDAWVKAGRPKGKEIQALADTLGFSPDELSILLN